MLKSAIIVGGGIAGLSSALELARHGVSVTVLEAKNRLGGRIHTVYSKGLPIELGAEYIHGRSPALLETIARAGLVAEEAQRHFLFFEQGRLKPRELPEELDRVFAKLSSRGPDLSFAEFLKRGNLSPFQQRMATVFAEGFNAAHTDRLSSQSLLLADYFAEKMEGTWQGRLREGYSALIDFLAQQIQDQGGRIELNTVVRKIEWKPGQVTLDLQRGRRRQTRKAQGCICTLPLGVWKSGDLHWNPPLPQKAAAAQETADGKCNQGSPSLSGSMVAAGRLRAGTRRTLPHLVG